LVPSFPSSRYHCSHSRSHCVARFWFPFSFCFTSAHSSTCPSSCRSHSCSGALILVLLIVISPTLCSPLSFLSFCCGSLIALHELHLVVTRTLAPVLCVSSVCDRCLF
jgi:hypothetical protein